jgi:hypothetical protein
MKCPQCGRNNPSEFAFCVDCGAQLSDPPADPSPRPRVGEPGGRDFAGLDFPAAGGARADRRPPRLRVEQGPVDGREFELDKPVVTIGRRLGNDIVVQDTNVSRHHARVLREDAGYAIEDTDSANGTVVNDERVEGLHPIYDGDVIRIGDAVLVFEAGEPAAGALEETRAVPLDSDQPIRAAAPAEVPAASEEFSPEPVAERGWLAPPPPIVEEEPADQRDRAVEAGEPSPALAAWAQAESPHAEPGLPTNADEAEGRLEVIRRDASDIGRDLEAAVSQLGGLAERMGGLERSLGEAGDVLEALEGAVRGPAAQPLYDLDTRLEELEATGGVDRLRPAAEVLDELADQPRDIELLLRLAQQAGLLRDVLHVHAGLLRAAPEARVALRRILGE